MNNNPTGMEEVIALEKAIRVFLATHSDAAATKIMAGLPATGTRLDGLRDVVRRLKLGVDS